MFWSFTSLLLILSYSLLLLLFNVNSQLYFNMIWTYPSDLSHLEYLEYLEWDDSDLEPHTNNRTKWLSTEQI